MGFPNFGSKSQQQTPGTFSRVGDDVGVELALVECELDSGAVGKQ